MIKKHLLRGLQTLLLLVAMQQLQAQQPPFWNEIEAFKKQDQVKPPPTNAIVFVGSSSFRMWQDVQDYFPGYTIINRGFGGSILPDVIRYVDDIIVPYKPKQVVVYAGDNDLAASDTITAETVAARFRQLFTLIRAKLPNANITFVAIKPSPSRQKLMPKQVTANTLIKQFLAGKPKTGFADVYYPMLGADKLPMPDLFKSDNLHMTAKGYVIWQKVIQPYLLK